MKIIFKIFEFFNNLISAHTKESSKRFIAIGTMALVSYVVILFTNHHNAEFILIELLSFVLLMVGVSVHEKIKTRKDE